MTAANVYQQVVETLVKSVSTARVSQQVVETLVKNISTARVSQEVVETLVKNISTARVSQFVTESLVQKSLPINAHIGWGLVVVGEGVGPLPTTVTPFPTCDFVFPGSASAPTQGATLSLPKQGYVIKRVQTDPFNNVLGCKISQTTDNALWILDTAGHILYHNDDAPGETGVNPKMLGAALHPTCDSSTGIGGYERRIWVPQGTYDIVAARFDNWPTTASGEMIDHTSAGYNSRAIWQPGIGLDGPGVAAAFTGVTGPGSGTTTPRTVTLIIEGASFLT